MLTSDGDGACSCEFLRFKCTDWIVNEMIAYLNSEERNHHNFQNFCFFLACLFCRMQGLTLLTNSAILSGK